MISASMMCADIARLGEVVRELNGVNFLHIDVMDGHFVPNFALGTDYCRMLRTMSTIPLDIHLMVEKPEVHILAFDPQPGDMVSIHVESTRHAQRTLKLIADCGALPIVALNPQTPISAITHLVDDIAAVLIMTVNPGYAGQRLIPAMLKKIAETRQFLNNCGHPEIRIEVDGNVSFEYAVNMRSAGAEIFVAGSSGIFSKNAPIEANVARLKGLIA